MIDNMRDARYNVETLRLTLAESPDLLADVLVALAQSDYEPGGYARYLCMAAWREALA